MQEAVAIRTSHNAVGNLGGLIGIFGDRFVALCYFGVGELSPFLRSIRHNCIKLGIPISNHCHPIWQIQIILL